MDSSSGAGAVWGDSAIFEKVGLGCGCGCGYGCGGMRLFTNYKIYFHIMVNIYQFMSNNNYK